MGLRARIALLVGATVLFATIIAGVGVVLSSRSAGVRLVDDQLQSDADIFVGPGGEIERRILAALAFRESGCGIDDPGDGRPGEGRAGRRGPGGPQGIVPGQFAAALQVVAPTGATVSTCGDLIEPADEELQIANRGRGRSARTLSYDGDRYRVLTLGIGSGGALQVARPLDLADGVVASLVARIVGFGLLGAIVAASLGWILARRAIRPVHELSDTAQRVAATQDLGERISSERDDELGDLATSFNTMLASLDQSRDQQRRFIQDASHELRTPLTSMRTNVELLRRHENIDAPTRERVLADIQLELHELSELSAELVDSATDVSPSTLNPVELELLSIVEGCVERARRRFGRQVDLHVNEPSIVLGDASLLTRAVANLVGNAVKFSPEGTSIDVSVDQGSVVVADRGPGIDADDLPHVFDRFYRATTARSAPGSGLGLSIVKQIVDAHEGTVSATGRRGGGAEVGFTLPVVPSNEGREGQRPAPELGE